MGTDKGESGFLLELPLSEELRSSRVGTRSESLSLVASLASSAGLLEFLLWVEMSVLEIGVSSEATCLVFTGSDRSI